MDDIAIIKQLRQSPPEGLRSLISKYQGLVGKISGNLLAGHAQDIEEVIADTFINIWKNIDKLDSDRGSLKGLLIITARRNAINRWHKLKNDRLLLSAEADLLPADNDILSALLQEEDNEILQQAINSLPEPDREIFVRRHYLLESVRQISRVIDLSEKQISNRLYQSKIRLRAQLQERSK